MKTLQIFTTGRHTNTAGLSSNFAEEQLQATATSYSPELHEAPIVIGHPKDNLPAYGWINSLSFTEGNLEAVPTQVDEQFAEMVNKGRFKKISASFYEPDSPVNPVPGTYYLRHVGFLGAQPPAVKGMRDASFKENEEGVITFEETTDHTESWWHFRSIGRILRSMREKVIADEGIEKADELIPNYAIEDLEGAQPPQDPEASPMFSEDTQVNEEQKAKQAELDQKESDLKAREVALKADQTAFSEQQKAQAEAGYVSFADQLIADNKITPAEKPMVITTQRALASSEDKVEFGEGDDKKEISALDAYREGLKARKSGAVDFNERSGGDDGAGNDEIDVNDLARKAQDYQESERKAGRTVSITQAIAAVKNQ